MREVLGADLSGYFDTIPHPQFSLSQKIVRQRRHITNGQFSDLAAADPLGFLDRSLAIFKDAPGIDKERLPAGVSATPLRLL
jgi:hypothetical protein